jgi:hypothetical protein
LTALLIAYDSLSSEYAPIEFMAGSDDAELQIVGYLQESLLERQEIGSQPVLLSPSFNAAAFGQQRSIVTSASSKMNNGVSWSESNCPIDLLKVPVYNFYELLRLLGDQHGTFISGSSNYYPNNSDLFHIITVAATHIGSVFCVYPLASGPSQGPWSLNYSIEGISWSTINWYQFQIDGSLSNSFTAAGGPAKEPDPSALINCVPGHGQAFPKTFIPLPLASTDVHAIRAAQELSVAASKVGVAAPGGVFHADLTIPAYTTTVFWITEFTTTPPTVPAWSTTPFILDTTDYGTNVALFWLPDPSPTFYSYQVSRDKLANVISPSPLRAALWVDTNPGAGSHSYWIQSVSASGIPSGPSQKLTLTVP